MRKAQAKKLPLAPDPKFNDKLVTRFVNNLMWEGKKSGAFTIFYEALDKVAKQTNEDGYEIWKKALANVTPGVEVRSRRIGGATFQIPSEVRADRKISLSIKWLIRYSRERNGRSMADKLAGEIVAASKGEGAAFKKKEDTHRMAEANKAFAHFIDRIVESGEGHAFLSFPHQVIYKPGYQFVIEPGIWRQG
jgi:small subunit ribosomal protein S7